MTYLNVSARIALLLIYQYKRDSKQYIPIALIGFQHRIHIAAPRRFLGIRSHNGSLIDRLPCVAAGNVVCASEISRLLAAHDLAINRRVVFL